MQDDIELFTSHPIPYRIVPSGAIKEEVKRYRTELIALLMTDVQLGLYSAVGDLTYPHIGFWEHKLAFDLAIPKQNPYFVQLS